MQVLEVRVCVYVWEVRVSFCEFSRTHNKMFECNVQHKMFRFLFIPRMMKLIQSKETLSSH